MAKHARKRQKTAQNKDHDGPVSNKAARLELLLDEESKDDEERRLESMLFGVKFVPKGKGKGKMPATSDDEEGEDVDDAEEEAGGRGMQHLMDQDVCSFCLLSYLCRILTSISCYIVILCR